MVEWILEDIGHLIDPKQFGCLRGSSTTLCLLDMFHSWLSKLDTDRCSLRIVLLDFSKAFDRINLNVLITKLIDMGLRRSLIPWLCDFLSNRRQRVKLGESISEWAQVNAGVPQGIRFTRVLASSDLCMCFLSSIMWRSRYSILWSQNWYTAYIWQKC